MISKCKITLFRIWAVIFVSSVVHVHSQTEKKDSLLLAAINQTDTVQVHTYLHIILSLDGSHKEEALSYAERVVSLSRGINYKYGLGKGYFHKGKLLYNLGKKDSGQVYMKKAVDRLKGLDDPEAAWLALDEFSRMLTLQGDFKSAIDNSKQAFDVAKAAQNGILMQRSMNRLATINMDRSDLGKAMEAALIGSRILDTVANADLVSKANNLGTIARIEMLRGNYDLTVAPLKKAVAYCKEAGNQQFLAINLLELGNAYWYLDEMQLTEKSYLESLEVSREIGNDDFIGICLGNLGLLYQEMKAYDKAVDYLKQSLARQRKFGSAINRAITLNDLGTTYAELGNLEDAIAYFNQGLGVADSIQALDISRDSYVGLANAYEKMENFKEALKNDRQAEKIEDSLFTAEKVKQIENLKLEYETEKKEQQIALQEAQIGLLEQRSRVNVLIGVLLLSALIISLVGYYAIRQKLKRNRSEREKLNAELEYKKRELTTHALHLAKKNEILEELKQKAVALRPRIEQTGTHRQLIRTIDADLKSSDNWKSFLGYFEEVHSDFDTLIKERLPEATTNDIRMLALIKMNLSTKEIASILNISADGVKKARYRLRKKLQLDTDVSLQDFASSL